MTNDEIAKAAQSAQRIVTAPMYGYTEEQMDAAIKLAIDLTRKDDARLLNLCSCRIKGLERLLVAHRLGSQAKADGALTFMEKCGVDDAAWEGIARAIEEANQ